MEIGDHARVVIDAVTPEIDCGRFAIKRVSGERVRVEALIFADGHDLVDAVIRARPNAVAQWREITLRPLGQDRFGAEFEVDEVGGWVYTIEAWIDGFGTWRRDLSRKVEAGVDIGVDLLVGAELLEAAARRAPAAARSAAERLRETASALRSDHPQTQLAAIALDDEVAVYARRFPDRSSSTSYARRLPLTVDRKRARFSAWYEFFPRSTGNPGEHGTLADATQFLDYVAGMGFDVVYLPPIHPIGSTNRKGRNGDLITEPGDVGSPWAIGSAAGGHTTIHPELGTMRDFEAFRDRATELGLEVAVDMAFQASPDHPYVKEHSEWFRRRPDGSLAFAENPPKRYEDIYPIDFESDDSSALWRELRELFEHWIDHGVSIFRVDNPHTKPYRFWEWLIADVKQRHEDVLFLSEAFTRPAVMHELAKRGFTQSYTYFTWRNFKWEIEQYFDELAHAASSEFFNPNVWPNTPDILSANLQQGGPNGFSVRVVLAATLSSNYGIYGPAFELCEARPRSDGSEEYLDSEKYQLRHWDLDDPVSRRPLITKLNAARATNPALQQNGTLRFHAVDNDQLICYSKVADAGSNTVLCVVNLDTFFTQGGWLHLDLGAMGLDGDFEVHDIITDSRYWWHGGHNFVELNPAVQPAHVFVINGAH